MRITNPSKALILLVSLICTTVLMAINTVDANVGMPVITGITMYGLGNGIAAKSGTDSTPVIGSKKNA